MSKIKFVDRKTFSEHINENDTDNIGIRKYYPCEKIEEVGSAEDLSIKFRITTPQVDRDNDTVSVDGWSLEDYKKNPVVLWAHDYRVPPIARATSIIREAESLDSVAQFLEKDVMDFSYMIYQLYKKGFMNAVSVGFKPDEWTYDDARGGINFIKQSLMEYSAVPVPSNPGALTLARSAGIETAPLKRWAENVLDDWEVSGSGLCLPKANIETLRKEADPKKIVQVGQVPVSTEKNGDQENTDKGSVKGDGSTKLIGPISYDVAHPEGTPKTEKDAEWNPLVEGDQDGDFMKMSAYAKDEKSFLFLHHLPDKGHLVVWDGVVRSMALLLGAKGDTQINSDERKKIYDHLAKHYEEFDEKAPDYKYVAAQVLHTMPDDYYFDKGQLLPITYEMREQSEKDAALVEIGKLCANVTSEKVLKAVNKAIDAFNSEFKGENDAEDVIIELDDNTETNDGDSENLIDINDSEVKDMIASAAEKALRKAQGKLD